MGAEAAHESRKPTKPAAVRVTGGRERESLGGGPLTASSVLRLQRTYGNHAVQRLLQRVPAGGGLVQRTPLSDDLAKGSAGKSPEQIFALVGLKKFQDGAHDPAELAALTGVLNGALSNPNDQWMAAKLLAGQLGMSQGVSRTEAPKSLKSDIPPQPVEVHFVQGTSNQRALVIAGVHGSERQGIDVAHLLIDDVLTKKTPYYSVILVPSLFPQNADKAWGAEGRRQGTTQTNRNFPQLAKRAATYKAGQALDPSGSPLQAAPVPVEVKDKGKTKTISEVDPILMENVMLMELIDRFHPSRIISIHGTGHTGAAGIFADPQFISPEKDQKLEAEAIAILAAVQAAGMPFPFTKDVLKQVLQLQQEKSDATQTQNDVDLALAAAYAINAKTKGVASLKGRQLPNADDAKNPSVAGNQLYKGAGNEQAGWTEDLDPKTHKVKTWQEREKSKGVSLGLYGPAKGISVFTVEPPVDRALDFYNGKNAEQSDDAPKGSKPNVVPQVDRLAELTAYAEAVATILLGPDPGAAALKRERPAATGSKP